jgi:hypothetical protein
VSNICVEFATKTTDQDGAPRHHGQEQRPSEHNQYGGQNQYGGTTQQPGGH